MHIYHYQVGNADYFGELVSEDTLERCLVMSKDSFELKLTGHQDKLSEVKTLVPCKPSKIICVGRNYQDHAAELGNAVPLAEPLLFLKPPSCLVPDGAEIVLPKGSERVDFEGEIALVIGKRCSKVSAENAYEYLLGVTAFNDVTARDWQHSDKQWTRAKGFDTSGPCGPYIDTSAAEALRIGGERKVPLTVTTLVNGEQRQLGKVSDLQFNFASLISYCSQYMTLLPQDLIVTGTPAGVGALAPGDEVVVELNCGPRLVNTVAVAK